MALSTCAITIVWGKGITVHVTSDSVRLDDGSEFYYTLIGRAESDYPRVISSLHPEYDVGSPSGCTGCVAAWVVFTPYAESADVARLMDINFSCLTRWLPCKTKADILPTAWNEAMGEKRSQKNEGKQACSPEVVRILARESLRVAIGTAHKIEESAGYAKVTIRLEGDLKPEHFLLPSPSGATRSFAQPIKEYQFSESLPVKERLGGHYYFFFEYRDAAPYPVNGDHVCDLLPATTKNLEIVRRGIAEDWTGLVGSR